jgi:hypothetical protein
MLNRLPQAAFRLGVLQKKILKFENLRIAPSFLILNAA